jgi:hypothetical protein
VKAPGKKQSRNDSPFAPRDPLVAELAKAESDLERIEAQRIAAKARIDSLRNELAALDATPRPVVPEPLPGLVPHTPANKVKLFRQSSAAVRTSTPHATKGLCVVLTTLIVRPVAFPSAAPQEAPLPVRARGRSFQLAAIQVFRDCFAPTEWHSPYRFRHRPEASA